jgi:hypothetical protein
MSINQAIDIQTTTLNAITPTTGVLSVGNTQTTGVFNLVTGVRTAAGIVNIATGTSNACAINILNGGGATTGGSVNIANGASQTTTVNIASGTGTGLVTIGSSTNTTTLASATINMNGNLIMGTGDNITLQPNTGYVAPTAGTMLGGITNGSFTTPASAFSANKNVATLTIPQVGIYLCSFSFRTNYTTKPTVENITVTGTALPLPSFICGGAFLSSTSDTFDGSFIAPITTAGTLVLTFTITGTVNTITVNSYSAVRIG